MIARRILWLADENGASAAEFALLLPTMVLLMFGIMHLCLLVYSATQLNYAAEATARCLVTSSNSGSSSATCATPTAAQTYFKALYHGATATPTFASPTPLATPTCNTTGTTNADYQVVVTASYVINAGILKRTVTLTSKACFPHT